MTDGSGALSVHAAAHERPDGLAIVTEDGARWTWSEVAAGLTGRLDGIGSPLASVIGDASAERVLDTLAAIDLGTPLLMLHPRWTVAEREQVLSDARGAAGPEGALAILYTSGTTGRAKGAILSRHAFEASARASARNLPLTSDDRWLLCMYIAHVGGLSVIVRSLIARSAIVIAGPFETERTLAVIARERPTLVSVVPTMLARMLDAGWAPHAELRAVLLGGAACPERTLARAIDAGLPIRTTYGLTEACSQVTTARQDVRSLDAGAGEPLPGIEVRIGATGTIAVRGPTMLDGWFPPGALPPPLDAEGWYDTGDLGSIDAQGRLHVLSRRTDLIVTGGENVYPAEVEAALEHVEGVRAACVFGVEDERWGQTVAAAVVGDAPDAVIAEALAVRLARFKIPRAIARVDALRVTGAGKIDRRATAEHARPLLRELAR